MKKIVALLMAVLFAVPFSAQAVTIRETLNETWGSADQVFSDVGKLHKNYRAVEMLNGMGVVKGYEDGSFKPNTAVNRAELTKMLVVAMTIGAPAPSADTYANCFPDVKTEWFAPYVCYAKEKGWVSGYPDKTFKPGNPVNRVEAMKIILNAMIPEQYWPSPTDEELALDLPTDAESGAWYHQYLLFSVAKQLLDGQHVVVTADGYSYKPGEPMYRKEVAEMMFRVVAYMMERTEYAHAITTAACLKLQNPSVSDTELQALFVAKLAEDGVLTSEEADELAGTYQSDDVLDSMIKDIVASTCGGDTTVDMTQWEFFLNQYAF